MRNDSDTNNHKKIKKIFGGSEKLPYLCKTKERKMNIIDYIKIYDEVYLPSYEKMTDLGIKKISRPSKDGRISQKTFGLLYLITKINEVVSKEEVTKEWVALTGIKTNDFQSLRHLGTQDGYDITNNRGGIGGYRLNSLSPKSGFIPERRNIEMIEDEWNSLKNQYDNKCAGCGDKEGDVTRYDRTIICKLEMGHMNPSKSLTLDNTIPQCEVCNRQYKNKYIFNKYGRVIGVC